ncbi:MAG: hypothetical protein II236_00280 [Alistipes sp.]|nr:hypothetical protein [Alistipes sp.]MBQ5903250.1 hypothetical protein [Alistipes sp.]
MKNALQKNEIRLVNENVDAKRIFIHLHSSNKPIIRTIEGREIHRFTNIRATEGMESAKQYICDLINEKYSEPQVIEKVKPSKSDEAYFERHAYSTIINSLL